MGGMVIRPRGIAGAAVALLLMFTAPIAAAAQSVEKVARIGVLSPTDVRGPLDELFERRLADLGWLKGRNVVFIYRYSRVNDALPGLATELVQQGVDIIATTGTPASLAAQRATSSIPIVFSSVGDPVGVGLVATLARPGGNVTGISGITYQLAAKRLELLKEVVPKLRLVGLLLNRTVPTTSQIFEALKRGAGHSGVTINPFYAGRPSEIDVAFEAMKQIGVDAVMVQPDGMFWAQRPRIVRHAANLRLPAVYAFKEDVEAGGLMSYGASLVDMQAQAIVYIDKILRGAAPSGLPVQEPSSLELVVNLKAAKALAITVPQLLLLRADRVVE